MSQRSAGSAVLRPTRSAARFRRVRTRMPVRTAALAVAVSLVSAVLAVLAPAASAACAPDPLVCPERIHVGASVDGWLSDPAAADAFTEATGVSPSVAMYFYDFGGRVDTTALRRLSDAGRLPMMTWEPWNHTTPSANPYSLQAIASGEFDAYLSAQGKALAAVGAPVAVRFAHEMNGDWYPWGQGANGNTPADYVAAYRHVHDVLTEAGASNVIWVWSPITVVSRPDVPLAPLYPGDEYVDWVGLSVYFSASISTYAADVPPTLRQLDLIAPDKPIYVAETSVLPGPDRPAMIRDLISGLLTIPDLVGLTWFNHDTNHDYRIDNDPAAAAELAAQLASPWFGGAGEMGEPVVAPPLVLTRPTVTGVAEVGETLTGTTGAWRSAAGSGNLAAGAQWYRCTDAVSTTTCGATGTTGVTYVPAMADRGHYLRFAETATNDAGSTVAWSKPTVAVLTTPPAPAAPSVEARDGALRLTFPAAPEGATHWQVSLDGRTRPLIPVSTTSYWIAGLTNGTGYTVGLAAVDSAPTGFLASEPTSGTAVPMSPPWSPYLQVNGTTVTVRLPSQAPAGATGWQLTVGSESRALPIPTSTSEFTGLSSGVEVPWSLRATAGDWNGQPGLSLPASGSVTPAAPPEIPAAPTVEARDGALRLTFPAAPEGATHWQLSLDGKNRPLIPVTTTTYWITGLVNGTSYTVGLAAATSTATGSSSGTAIGPATAGTAVPMTTPGNPYLQVNGTTVTVKLPSLAPAGATGWQLTVGAESRTLPISTSSSEFTDLPPGVEAPWSLRATAGDWNGQPGLSLPASGTATPAPPPALPARPAVEARDNALRLTFPAVPAGATHWQVSVDGVVRPLVPVSTTSYWITGLVNGTGYPVGLAAATVSSTSSSTVTAIGPATTGTAVPLPAPGNPSVRVTGETATFALPAQTLPPSASWVLTVDGTATTLPPATRSHTVPGLAAEASHSWTLHAAAGSWDGEPDTSTTPSVTGTFTAANAPETPAAPAVEARDGALRLTLPAVPARATHWQLSVDGAVKPLIPVSTATYWVTGLRNGTAYRVELAAVTVSSGSTAGLSVAGPGTTGAAVPMTTPWNPYLQMNGGVLTVKLPPQWPAGATGWQLTVGSETRTLPLSTTSSQFTGLPPGVQTPWSLRATAGNWNGQPGLSLPASGTITP
jgi:glycosyl hydrolase family 26